MATDNGPFINAFPDKTSIYGGFAIAMFDYQRVSSKKRLLDWYLRFVMIMHVSTRLFFFFRMQKEVSDNQTHLILTDSDHQEPQDYQQDLLGRSFLEFCFHSCFGMVEFLTTKKHWILSAMM